MKFRILGLKEEIMAADRVGDEGLVTQLASKYNRLLKEVNPVRNKSLADKNIS